VEHLGAAHYAHLGFPRSSANRGVRCVLKVLAYLLEQGEDDELRRTIERHGRQIKVLQGLRPRARRH
jgi:hypothetical protein